MRLRGLAGARDEFHLAAIVQNLKTMAGDTVADVADKLWVADCAMVNLLKPSVWRQIATKATAIKPNRQA